MLCPSANEFRYGCYAADATEAHQGAKHAAKSHYESVETLRDLEWINVGQEHVFREHPGQTLLTAKEHVFRDHTLVNCV